MDSKWKWPAEFLETATETPSQNKKY